MELSQNSILISLSFIFKKRNDWQSASETQLRWQWAQLSDRNFIV